MAMWTFIQVLLIGKYMSVRWVTVEPVGYASFWRVYVTIRNREPPLVTFLRNRVQPGTDFFSPAPNPGHNFI